MRTDLLRKLLLPHGPVLSLTLMGMLLLGAVLYYRAVRAQRFIEPAVAISQPRIEFAKKLRVHLHKEFGPRQIPGIIFTTDAILVKTSLLDRTPGQKEPAIVAGSLGKIFLAIMNDPEMRSYINFIVVRTSPTLSADRAVTERRRAGMQHLAEEILRSLYWAEPSLERDYATYFTAAAVPVDPGEDRADWVEFKVIPSEQLHIDVLIRLEKYVH